MNKVDVELLRIAEKHGGLLKPEDVVSAAASPKSPLHSKFTWDDSEAAHAYRLWQARQLIKTSVTVIKDIKAPMFMSVTVDRKMDGGYRSIVSIMSDEDRRAQLLQDALDELKLFKKKYALLVELSDVFDAIRKVSR